MPIFRRPRPVLLHVVCCDKFSSCHSWTPHYVVVRCLLSTLSQHVSGIIMPIFRRPRRVLLHVVCCDKFSSCHSWTPHYVVVWCSTVRCLLSTLSQHVLGIIMPIFRRPRRVLLHLVCCNKFSSCYSWTPHYVVVWCSTVRCLLSALSQHVLGIIMPETCWESANNKHLTVASCWFSLSLHNLLTMHGHRNLMILNWPLLICICITDALFMIEKLETL